MTRKQLMVMVFIFLNPATLNSAFAETEHTATELESSQAQGVRSNISASAIDEIVVVGEAITDRDTIASFPYQFPTAIIDSAELLKTLPGANVNSNGPITGIAQYRGLYGDRVPVLMDNQSMLTGGPNSMDTPLSYAPPLLLESLSIVRGIAPVSSSQESIGGQMTATLDRGKFTDSASMGLNAGISTRYNSIDSSEHHALKIVGANNQHKIAVLASYDEGDDSESGNDDLVGTAYQRQRYDLSYGWQNDTTTTEISIGRLETDNTGTPALPMDILYIDSSLANFKASRNFEQFTLNTRMGYSHVDHGMDNYSLRGNANPMKHRLNTASAQQLTWGVNLEIPVDILDTSHQLTIGVDSTENRHDAVVTNPNMAAFQIENFANAERNIYGLFAQLDGDLGPWNFNAGIRYNRIEMDSDPVSSTGMMPMLANVLSNDFNTGDTAKDFNNIDLVFKASRPLSDNLIGNVGLGRKTRAPSYQERYLWLPMESTGGLADGRTYIGNLELDSEVSHEITLGLEWQKGKFQADGEIFYRDINDYIQGTPSINTTANTLALMMSGKLPLQFNNIDAELYGFDGSYGYQLSDSWSLHGVLSLVRGRSDAGDNLYRLPPLNHRLTLSWIRDNTDIHLESVLYDEQSHISSFNNEAPTAGYGLINLRGNYQVTKQLRMSLGIENLFDKYYRDHLASYNRNVDNTVAVGDRLPGSGRNIYIGINLSI